MLTDGFHDVAEGHVAVIVTHLEMHALPDLPDATLPDDIAFRRVERPTPEWYRDVFFRVGSQDWLWNERLRMSDKALRDVIHDPNVQVYTLEKDGQAEALLELDFRKPPECELAYFGLTPALIGKGAGRYLMNKALSLAWARPISRLTVHTCTADSPQALDFYQRSGFTAFRRQVEIAPDPRLDGTLPRDAARWFPAI